MVLLVELQASGAGLDSSPGKGRSTAEDQMGRGKDEEGRGAQRLEDHDLSREGVSEICKTVISLTRRVRVEQVMNHSREHSQQGAAQGLMVLHETSAEEDGVSQVQSQDGRAAQAFARGLTSWIRDFSQSTTHASLSVKLATEQAGSVTPAGRERLGQAEARLREPEDQEVTQQAMFRQETERREWSGQQGWLAGELQGAKESFGQRSCPRVPTVITRNMACLSAT